MPGSRRSHCLECRPSRTHRRVLSVGFNQRKNQTEIRMSETADIELSKGSQIRALIPSGQRGVELRSLDDFYRFAQYVWAANMVPNGITNVEGVLIAMQRGAEVG